MMFDKRKVIVVLIVMGFFLIIPAQAQSESMPEGEGKALVSGVCTGCHTLDMVLMQSKTRGQWETTVQDMISRGAQIFPDEQSAIVGYLAEHYGADSRPPSDSPQSAKDLFNSKCFQCHGDAYWKNLKANQKEWTGIIYRMVGRGALWTEEEINTMAEYLAETRGRGDD